MVTLVVIVMCFSDEMQPNDAKKTVFSSIISRCTYRALPLDHAGISVPKTLSSPITLVILQLLHCVSKKRPTCKLSVTLSNLNRFSKFLHCWTYKIRYKTLRQYPPHLRHVATLRWEIRNSNFLQIFSRYGRKCKQIAF